jgi:glycosyltransferase involved in cell wall biosynthesis
VGRRLRWIVVGPTDPAKADGVDEASRRDAERDGVTFLGFRSDMPAIYAVADLLVLASHREGFPRAAMEAAAMGLPLVATDIRGCRQVVEPDVTGLLIPSRDPDALARAVEALSTAPPAERATMGRAGRAKALREFDQRRVIETTLSVYRRLMAGRAGV